MVNPMRTYVAPALLLLAAAACSASDRSETDSAAAADSTAASTQAATDSVNAGGVQVAMRDSAGRDLGTLTVAESGGMLTVSGTLRGLPPGTHGIHFHMTGSCEPPFESAGGHWNPSARQHGVDNPNGPHAGDLRNIEVGADSTANVQTSASGGMLRGDTGLMDADGAAIIVHATADDNKTDPSGNSGARIACGRVGM
jgi:superoxide dismutase, Cu-Zn family